MSIQDSPFYTRIIFYIETSDETRKVDFTIPCLIGEQSYKSLTIQRNPIQGDFCYTTTRFLSPLCHSPQPIDTEVFRLDSIIALSIEKCKEDNSLKQVQLIIQFTPTGSQLTKTSPMIFKPFLGNQQFQINFEKQRQPTDSWLQGGSLKCSGLTISQFRNLTDEIKERVEQEVSQSNMIYSGNKLDKGNANAYLYSVNPIIAIQNYVDQDQLRVSKYLNKIKERVIKLQEIISMNFT
jgi:hypothetical protein